MSITDLYEGLPEEIIDKIHDEILKLQKRLDWVGCDLTADGLIGLVWLKPEGIQVMSAPPAIVLKPDAKVKPPAEKPQVFVPDYRDESAPVGYPSAPIPQSVNDRLIAPVKSSFRDVKRKRQEIRREFLYKKYHAAQDQLLTTLNAMDTITGKQQIKQIEQEIEEVEQELQQL